MRISDWSSDVCSSDLLLIDGRRSNSGQITASYLSAIAAEVGAEANPGTGPATPVAVRNWFNPNLTYRWFIVPGLSGILAFFSALLITSLSIARERELGTFDQLLVSPTSTPEIIISKSLPALVIGTMLGLRSEEHTSELQSLMRISYAVLCLHKNNKCK